jgi:BAI1-associated protein 3
VFEAAKKLNEVKSMKGIERYFKQIAQSARTNTNDKNAHVDDFLGSVDIHLDDIPSIGQEKWYELEGKSEKSRVTGTIRLRVKLATREDRGDVPDDDNWNDFKQQLKLISIFIDRELSKLEAEGGAAVWNGQFCREAETILHQHAIQGDMTDFQIAIWFVVLSFLKYYKKQIDLFIFDCKAVGLHLAASTCKRSCLSSCCLRSKRRLTGHGIARLHRVKKPIRCASLLTCLSSTASI